MAKKRTPKTKQASAQKALDVAHRVQSRTVAARDRGNAGAPPAKRDLSAAMFPDDDTLTAGDLQIVARVKEIVQLDMLGEYPKDIEKKTGMSHDMIEQLRVDYPTLFEKCKAQFFEGIAERFTINFMRAHVMVGAFSPDAVKTLNDIMVDSDQTAVCRKDAAKAILSFAADLVAGKSVKRSGAQHPHEIKVLAEKAQGIMGEGKKPTRTPSDAIEEPN